MKISLGMVIAVCLIVYWFNKDHPGVLWGDKPTAAITRQTGSN